MHLLQLPKSATVTNATPQGVGKETPRRKRDKLRSAWISFAGRIVAQIIGAAATVLLSVILVQHYMVASMADQPALDPGMSSAARIAARPSGEMALAVLPVLNLSNDPQQEYFADGMTEALITKLARTNRLHVISRTSSMYYKDHRRRLPEIARELNVDLIVEGSVTLAGGRARVTAQLIDARTDEHLWAHAYDRSLKDVISFQDFVAQAIAREVHDRVVVQSVSHQRPQLRPLNRALLNRP